MNISEESLRFLSDLFIGDKEGIFTYKSGSKIFSFFNKYFGYDDVYSFGCSYPSRWTMARDKIVDLWNKGLFNAFLSKILSISYLKVENKDYDNEKLKHLSDKAVSLLNEVFVNDGNKVVEVSGSFKLTAINDDEEFLGEGGYACCFYIKSKGIVEKRLKEECYADPGIVSRFKREYQITKSLGDIQGIIKVLDFNEKQLSYTMERGECDLYSYIEENELDDAFRKNIVYQIATIMKKVHDRDKIHRDLSPNNIFIRSGLLKIADFGLGKDLNAFHSHQTMKTNSVGQYYYCDPRQFMKLKDGDKQSDIYSIGKIINFVFTKDPNNTSHYYYAVSAKATALDPKYRYKTMEELIEGLQTVDKRASDKHFEERFNEKILNGEELDEEDVNYICSFSGEKMFKAIGSINFRTAFVSLGENGALDESVFLSKLEMLEDYYKSKRFFNWNDYDSFGYLGSTIIGGNFSYAIKEKAISLINIPISCNRYAFIEMVKRKIVGNIEPALEELLDDGVKTG